MNKPTASSAADGNCRLLSRSDVGTGLRRWEWTAPGDGLAAHSPRV